MVIGRVGDLAATSPSADTRVCASGGGAGFAADMAGAMRAEAAVAVQAHDAAAEDDDVREAKRRDRAARRTGNRLLDGLVELQCMRVAGAPAQAGLDRLAEILGRVPLAADPGLAETMRAVVLRTRIELHRHG